MSNRWSRTAGLLGGLVLFGVSIALMVRADLGLASWDVLHQGIARRTGLPLGWVINLTAVLVLLLWLPLRQRPGPGTVGAGTVLYAVGIGPLTQFFLSKLEARPCVSA